MKIHFFTFFFNYMHFNLIDLPSNQIIAVSWHEENNIYDHFSWYRGVIVWSGIQHQFSYVHMLPHRLLSIVSKKFKFYFLSLLYCCKTPITIKCLENISGFKCRIISVHYIWSQPIIHLSWSWGDFKESQPVQSKWISLISSSTAL